MVTTNKLRHVASIQSKRRRSGEHCCHGDTLDGTLSAGPLLSSRITGDCISLYTTLSRQTSNRFHKSWYYCWYSTKPWRRLPTRKRAINKHYTINFSFSVERTVHKYTINFAFRPVLLPRMPSNFFWSRNSKQCSTVPRWGSRTMDTFFIFRQATNHLGWPITPAFRSRGRGRLAVAGRHLTPTRQRSRRASRRAPPRRDPPRTIPLWGPWGGHPKALPGRSTPPRPPPAAARPPTSTRTVAAG